MDQELYGIYHTHVPIPSITDFILDCETLFLGDMIMHLNSYDTQSF